MPKEHNGHDFDSLGPKNITFEGEGEVAGFSAMRWNRRNRADLIESAAPCHDAQVVGLEPTPSDCSDFKVRGSHHCATTPSRRFLSVSDIAFSHQMIDGREIRSFFPFL